ncbi:MAG TPA: GNAT family N-acetyltransferase [Candidatus Limnocylindrales bacterium]
MTRIRAATIADLPGAYRVCLLTGDAGRDATAMFRNPDLLGHVYVGPYVVGSPDLARVVVDPDGVAGYLLAAADTRAFEAWAEGEWWPALREQHPLLDHASPDAELIRSIHRPPLAPEGVVAAYPSHLHLDLLERARGLGLGRALIEGLLVDLRGRGSRGVHLNVATANENAIAFYRHLGFETLEALDDSLVMGMRLD